MQDLMLNPESVILLDSESLQAKLVSASDRVMMLANPEFVDPDPEINSG
jgi:hypothetical protein